MKEVQRKKDCVGTSFPLFLAVILIVTVDPWWQETHQSVKDLLRSWSGWLPQIDSSRSYWTVFYACTMFHGDFDQFIRITVKHCGTWWKPEGRNVNGSGACNHGLMNRWLLIKFILSYFIRTYTNNMKKAKNCLPIKFFKLCGTCYTYCTVATPIVLFFASLWLLFM